MREPAHPMVTSRPIDDDGFREAMSTVVAPITIVTACNDRGEPFGFTASAVTSVSLDPPLLLVCVDRGSSSHDLLVAATQFCVNVMGTDGMDLALRFGARRSDKFHDLVTENSPSGTPSLPMAMSRIFCTVHGLLEGGDHTIVLGRVHSFRHHRKEPLTLWRRGFRRLGGVV